MENTVLFLVLLFEGLIKKVVFTINLYLYGQEFCYFLYIIFLNETFFNNITKQLCVLKTLDYYRWNNLVFQIYLFSSQLLTLKIFNIRIGQTITYNLLQTSSELCSSVAPTDPGTALVCEGDSWTVMETKEPVYSDG